MSMLLSLLLVACVSMVVATSIPESDHHHHVMIAKHLTAAVHSFRTAQTSTAAADPTYGSAACKSTSLLLETNSAVVAAHNSVIASGCTKPAEQTCSTISRTCTCIATYSNDANLRSLVSQAGGQVCSLDIQATLIGSNGVNVDINYRGVAGLTVIGSSCNNNDIQTMLNAFFDAFAQGIRQGSAQSTSNTKITSISGTMSFCGTSYTGTRQTSGAYNTKPVGIAIALLIGIIITISNAVI